MPWKDPEVAKRKSKESYNRHRADPEWCEKNRQRLKKYYAETKTNRHEQLRKERRMCIDRNRRFLLEYKLARKCQTCPENHPATLDFHHRKGEVKVDNVGRLARLSRSLEVIQAEIAKCDLLCANCHRKLTCVELDWYTFTVL